MLVNFSTEKVLSDLIESNIVPVLPNMIWASSKENQFLFSRFLKSRRGYSKTCVKRPLSKRPKIGFQDQLSLNAGQTDLLALVCDVLL